MYDLQTEQAAVSKEFFRAINNHTRLAVLAALSESSGIEYTVTELYTMFQTDQPTMSVHLRALRENKLVKTREVGKTIYYSLNQEGIDVANKVSNTITKFLK